MSAVAQMLRPFIAAGGGERHDEFEQTLLACGFAEAGKTIANLTLLHEFLGDADVVAIVAATALESADADMALNNLERCSEQLDRAELTACLNNASQRRQLLLMLGASTFLTSILCRDGDYFRRLFVANHIARSKSVDDMLAELTELVPADADFATLQRCLRRYKYGEILRIAGRDLSGVDDLAAVTAQLSCLAAATLRLACNHCQRLLQQEYGRPLEYAADGTTLSDVEATFTVLGMGKFGGWELNFSSDIDLIYFYSTTAGKTAGCSANGKIVNQIDLHHYFVKLAEHLTRAIAQVTEDGFVFRVDLDLRPEGRSGELACSQAAAETYYESWGQNWERSAMMKARAVAGDLALGERILKALEPFIYRRYLDYGMVEDLKVMKQKIDSHQAQQRDCSINLKLGCGGIREIEFFVQALQLIYAGKNPAVRSTSTLKALELLHVAGYLSRDDAEVLRCAYVFMRTVEHRIQVFQERQTHNLPSNDADMLRLARRCGFSSRAQFVAELERHRTNVTRIYRSLFYVDEDEQSEEISAPVRLLLDEESDSDLVKDVLEEHGFSDVERAYAIMTRLRDGQLGPPMTRRVRRYYQRALPPLLHELLNSPEPDMALLNLEEFLSRARAQGTFYALLAENTAIIKLLISLFGTSKFLSRFFLHSPELLDSLVLSANTAREKSLQELRDELEQQLRRGQHYEDYLDILRRFRKEEFLRIALNDLRGDVQQGSSQRQLSHLAIACLEQAVNIARAELIPRFGLPFCQNDDGDWSEAQFAVQGMGKLGGLELNYHSDLDIIFLYDGGGRNRPVDGSDSERFKELTNSEYFAKLAQRIITVLTLTTREGRVYEIDTRLRPSGNQGPLVTSLSAYAEYHRTQAQLWERQALTKAQVVVGGDAIRRRIEAINEEVTWLKPLPPQLRAEIYRLRQRMEKEIAREDDHRFNIKTGRGGMVDVEFIVQYLQLLHGRTLAALRLPNTLAALAALRAQEIIPADEEQILGAGYKFLRKLENRLRLVHDQSFNQLTTDKKELRKLARHFGYSGGAAPPEQEFISEYRSVTGQIRQLFDKYLDPDK